MKSQKQNKYLILLENLFDKKLSKSERTKLRIIESAITGYVEHGFSSLTYDKIAKIAQVSRPLIINYFPRPEELFGAVVTFIRANLQRKLVEEIRSQKTARKQFEAYLHAHFTWFRERPDHVKVWYLFYFESSRNPSLRKLHTQMTQMGAARIQELFSKRSKDSYTRARLVQAALTGALVCLGTEDLEAAPKDLEKRVVDSCMKLGGF